MESAFGGAFDGNGEVLPEAAKENQKLKRKAKNHSAKSKTKNQPRMNTKRIGKGYQGIRGSGSRKPENQDNRKNKMYLSTLVFSVNSAASFRHRDLPSATVASENATFY